MSNDILRIVHKYYWNVGATRLRIYVDELNDLLDICEHEVHPTKLEVQG